MTGLGEGERRWGRWPSKVVCHITAPILFARLALVVMCPRAVSGQSNPPSSPRFSQTTPSSGSIGPCYRIVSASAREPSQDVSIDRQIPGCLGVMVPIRRARCLVWPGPLMPECGWISRNCDRAHLRSKGGLTMYLSAQFR
ncbi:hypothetical protein V8C43DRAFT_222649 [Trichoderma afarasin]